MTTTSRILTLTATRLRQASAAITWLSTFGLRRRERLLWWNQLLQVGIGGAATAGVFALAGGRWDGLWPFDPVNAHPLAAAGIVFFGSGVLAYVVELEARLTERRRSRRAGERSAQNQPSDPPRAMSDQERQIILAALARHQAMPINTIAEDDVLETRCAELLTALDNDTATGIDALVLAEYVHRYARPYPALPQLTRPR